MEILTEKQMKILAKVAYARNKVIKIELAQHRPKEIERLVLDVIKRTTLAIRDELMEGLKNE